MSQGMTYRKRELGDPVVTDVQVSQKSAFCKTGRKGGDLIVG